ncbi:MAG: transposase, partial [Usitatibacter sp.]
SNRDFLDFGARGGSIALDFVNSLGSLSKAYACASRECREACVAQRALARKKRGSGGRREARNTVARCHAAVARQRTDHLHQASARLVRDYDAIAVEKLNIEGLARGVLAKDVHDASWARFIAMLRYKAERAGVRLIEVDPRNTTQDCSGCGMHVPKGLGDRRHACPHCGLTIDRDLNAARNILNRAGVGPDLRNVAGCGMRAGENLGAAPRARQRPVAPD